MSCILTNSIEETRKIVGEWKREGFKVALVPTMGALHKGHESLMQRAAEYCDKTVVSVFVNPIQFCPNEDYNKYPRDIEEDLKVCQNNDVNVVFAPTPTEMYGKNLTKMTNENLTFVYPPYNLVDTLCGKTRTGHFDGVTTVVTKLLNIVQPDYAFFGQKDAQQLIIINKLVKDLNIPVEIVPCEIIREENGLALSSRNNYLSEEDKQKALSINKSLLKIKELYSQGILNTNVLLDSAITILDKDIELEYFEFVDFENLEKIDTINKRTLVAIAAKINNVRLIDNVILE